MIECVKKMQNASIFLYPYYVQVYASFVKKIALIKNGYETTLLFLNKQFNEKVYFLEST